MYTNTDFEMQFNNEPRDINIYQRKRDINSEYSEVNGRVSSVKKKVEFVYFALCAVIDSLLLLGWILLSCYFMMKEEQQDYNYVAFCMLIAGNTLFCDIVSIVGIFRLVKGRSKVFISSIFMKAAGVCLGCTGIVVAVFMEASDFEFWTMAFAMLSIIFAIIACIFSKSGKKNVATNRNCQQITNTKQKAHKAGSRSLLKNLGWRNYLGLIVSVIMIAISIFCIIIFVVVPGEVGFLFIFLQLGVFGGRLLYISIRNLTHPEKMYYLKKSPDALWMLDELSDNVIYEDRFITLSDRLIGSKERIIMQGIPVAFTDEVFRLIIHEESEYGIPTTKELILITARGNLYINVYGRRTAKVNALIERILNHCRYARFGEDKDTLEYEQWMRKAWERDKAYKDRYGYTSGF